MPKRLCAQLACVDRVWATSRSPYLVSQVSVEGPRRGVVGSRMVRDLYMLHKISRLLFYLLLEVTFT